MKPACAARSPACTCPAIATTDLALALARAGFFYLIIALLSICCWARGNARAKDAELEEQGGGYNTSGLDVPPGSGALAAGGSAAGTDLQQ